jgi:cation-transporting ATPase 13A3/4/5
LTQLEADKRHEIIGKNEIPYEPESLLQSAYVELFSLFHVYQLVMYLLWFWNSYLFVAALLTVIVCMSAAITIYTRHQSQKTIAKVYPPHVILSFLYFVTPPYLIAVFVFQLTRHVTQVEVYRDKAWHIVDSRKVVPGDVVRVTTDWLLPCDLVIIKGI